MGRRIHSFLCHHFNSLHVFCKLRRLKVPKPLAYQVAVWWEKKVHRVLYSR
ncbi:hypothetical protein G4V39_03580 [Thermosulfuriphilus ammonigenes]|uniref:Uncharacterized protein n=1 Tax=Thermosulfuriphilus ammonigenes TaxID=1936021 RepID=A0A6G7PV62_9BACT|nr:hypothetical protein [Thermosulfuriphilus ammonigenes]MBA2848435.1 hypothetical protein [Thermosulfuriphilus ammonigenes]QIJ71411.1 hypothetical protein G4V39_03580 [Thermosulfuriphilus ammonigenes]